MENYTYSKDGKNPFKRLWQVFSSPTHSRTLGILTLLIIVAAVPLTIYIAQQQQELRQKAASSLPSYCKLGGANGYMDQNQGGCEGYGGDMKPSEACPMSDALPGTLNDNNYLWITDCDGSKGFSTRADKPNCVTNNDCKPNITQQGEINPGTSNWCYGFNNTGTTSTNRCLQLKWTGGGGSCSGNACNDCVMEKNPGIINVWAPYKGIKDIQCSNQSNIVNQWCSEDPNACNQLKTVACKTQCGAGSGICSDPGGPCSYGSPSGTKCCNGYACNPNGTCGNVPLTAPPPTSTPVPQGVCGHEGDVCFTSTSEPQYTCCYGYDCMNNQCKRQTTITPTATPTPGCAIIGAICNTTPCCNGDCITVAGSTTKKCVSRITPTTPVTPPCKKSGESCGASNGTCCSNAQYCCSGKCSATQCTTPPTATATPTGGAPTATSTPRPTNSPTPTGTGPTATSTPTGGAPTGTATPTNTPVPGGTQLALDLILDGIFFDCNVNSPCMTGAPKPPLHPARDVTVDIFTDNSATQPILTKTGSVTYNSTGQTDGHYIGNIELGSIETGDYIVKVKATEHLRRAIEGIQNIIKGTANTTPETILIAGDIDNNNALTILDYNILISCIANEAGTGTLGTCSDENKLKSDLNDDGVVDNLNDLNLFIRSLATQRGD